MAVLHPLRTLHDWLKSANAPQDTLRNLTIHAGDCQSVSALRRWFQIGALTLQSAAASPLAEDIRRLPTWLETNLSLLPFNLPMDVPAPDDLPPVYRDIGIAFEVFRQCALPILGDDWFKTLPRIPLTKEEVKSTPQAQLVADEMLVLRQLSTMGSVSAEILVSLELTREIVRAAFTILQGERSAQVTLAAILSGTRFRCCLNGVLVPVKCPNRRGGAPCGAADSFTHLLRCYRLQKKPRWGPNQ